MQTELNEADICEPGKFKYVPLRMMGFSLKVVWEEVFCNQTK